MSKAVWIGAIALAIATLVPAGQALAQPSADEIIGKYIEAIGGKAAIEKIKTRKTVGKFSLPDMGIEAPMTTIQAPPNMWSEVNVESMGMMVHRGLSDGVAWELNPMQGPRVLEGGEKAGMIRQASIEPWLAWKDHYKDAKVEGEEAVGDKTAYKVVLTPKEGDPETYFFDKADGLLIQTQQTTEGMVVTGTMSEYKEADGVKVASKIEQAGGMMGTVVISFDTIENNVEVDPAQFALPEEIKALQSGATPEPATTTP